MTYASGHPVRLAGGRLALDLANTADWSPKGAVVHEKIADFRDLAAWMDAVGLTNAVPPEHIDTLHTMRRNVRNAAMGGKTAGAAQRAVLAELLRAPPAEHIDRAPLLSLIAASAVSILSDQREYGRIKMCPGHNCGWLFIDETKNRRRKWCLMETCGNRAKSARHYERSTRTVA